MSYPRKMRSCYNRTGSLLSEMRSWLLDLRKLLRLLSRRRSIALKLTTVCLPLRMITFVSKWNIRSCC